MIKWFKYVFQNPYLYLLRALQKSRQDHISFHAATLTFYTLFALVPFLGLLFGLAQSFGFESILKTILKELFEAQEDIYNNLLVFTDNLLNQTKEQVIAGVGFIILIWSVYKIFYLLDHIFNRIWGISFHKSPMYRIHQFAAILLLMPIVLVIASGAFLYGIDMIDKALPVINLELDLKHFFPSDIKIISLILFSILFGISYWGLPAVEIPMISALIAGFVGSLLFHGIQWGYVVFQGEINRFGIVYGSFAGVPLFMLWIYLSWIVYFFGAELAFILESKITKKWPLRFQYFPIRIQHGLCLKIMDLIIERFKEGETALSTKDIAHLLDLPSSVIRYLLELLLAADLITITQDRFERVTRYAPKMSISLLSQDNIQDHLVNASLMKPSRYYGEQFEEMLNEED